MPLLQVSLVEGRAPEVKERLIAVLTDAVVDVIGARRETVRVILTDVPAAHWGVGGTSKQPQPEQERPQ
jgi:4-oxalocrotonate tautomerase